MSLHIDCKLSLHACTCVLSRVRLLATPWTVVFQTPLSLEFSRQQSWSGLPFPPPGDLPKPRIKPVSPVLASRFFTAGTTWDAWKWALLGILSRCSSPGHFLRAGVFYSSVGLLNTKRPEGRNWPQEAAFRNAPPGYLGNQRLGKVVLLGCGSQPKGPRWTPKDLRLITWILIVFWSILEYIVGLITFRYICVNAGDIIAFIFYASITQLCPTLCHPVDCSPPGSSVRGILQARILEWVAISSSRGSNTPLDTCTISFYPFLYWWTLFLSALRENCFPFLSFYHLKSSYLRFSWEQGSSSSC